MTPQKSCPFAANPNLFMEIETQIPQEPNLPFFAATESNAADDTQFLERISKQLGNRKWETEYLMDDRADDELFTLECTDGKKVITTTNLILQSGTLAHPISLMEDDNDDERSLDVQCDSAILNKVSNTARNNCRQYLHHYSCLGSYFFTNTNSWTHRHWRNCWTGATHGQSCTLLLNILTFLTWLMPLPCTIQMCFA